MDGYGTTHTDTLSPVGDHPGRLHGDALTFYLHIDTAETGTTTAYDKLTVKAGSARPLATYSNLNAATGYAQQTFNLSSFAGQTITVCLHRRRGLLAADLVRHRRHGGDAQLAPHRAA